MPASREENVVSFFSYRLPRKPLTRGCGPSATFRLLVSLGDASHKPPVVLGLQRPVGTQILHELRDVYSFCWIFLFVLGEMVLGFFFLKGILHEEIVNENLVRNEDCFSRAKIIFQCVELSGSWRSLKASGLLQAAVCIQTWGCETHTSARPSFISSPSVFGFSLERMFASSEEECVLCCHCIALCSGGGDEDLSVKLRYSQEELKRFFSRWVKERKGKKPAIS